VFYTARSERPQREEDGTTAKAILIVEDHRFFSEMLQLLLGQRFSGGLLGQATFHRATTVEEALRLVAEAGPFGLAVVDLMLPDGDGTDVVRAVKERWPGTPVCVLSSVEDLSGALSAGADEAIHKSTPITEVIATLARLATGGGRSAT